MKTKSDFIGAFLFFSLSVGQLERTFRLLSTVKLEKLWNYEPVVQVSVRVLMSNIQTQTNGDLMDITDNVSLEIFHAPWSQLWIATADGSTLLLVLQTRKRLNCNVWMCVCIKWTWTVLSVYTKLTDHTHKHNKCLVMASLCFSFHGAVTCPYVTLAFMCCYISCMNHF